MRGIMEQFEYSKFEVTTNLFIVISVLVVRYSKTGINTVFAIDVSPLGAC